MRVLVTGALGMLGRATLAALLAEGAEARAFDLDRPPHRRLAKRLDPRIDLCLGDLRDPSRIAAAVRGVDAVIHDAGILPPATERDPDRAHSVNVGGTRALIDAMTRHAPMARLVFASSVSVHGPGPLDRPVRASDPIAGSDVYTEHKVACGLIQASALEWVILRVGAVLGAAGTAEPTVLRMLFEVRPDQPVEVIHVADAALAQARAALRPGVTGRVLLLGGGARCQIRHRDLVELAFGAVGAAPPPVEAFGTQPFYTAWMESDETERLLTYQQRGIDEIREDLAASLGRLRPVLGLLRPVTRWFLLRHSGPLAGHPPNAGWRDLVERYEVADMRR